jgi:translation elongation factor EF-Ts
LVFLLKEARLYYRNVAIHAPDRLFAAFAGPLQVSGLLRVQVGEGMERESDKADFASEVAAMAAGGK